MSCQYASVCPVSWEAAHFKCLLTLNSSLKELFSRQHLALKEMMSISKQVTSLHQLHTTLDNQIVMVYIVFLYKGVLGNAIITSIVALPQNVC